MNTVGVVSPGMMGAAVGANVADAVSVVWASEGRSEATRRRADDAGMQDVETLAALCHDSDVVLSICPPSEALDTARAVATLDFRGVYVDANAVSPSTVHEIQGILGSGAEFVDGAIIGSPPTKPGLARLHLAGPRAEDVAQLFRGGHLDTSVMAADIPAASHLKIANAAWSKGEVVLLLGVLAYARSVGVTDELLDQWEMTSPGMPERIANAERRAGPRAWRWAGEMREVAASFTEQNLPDGFHQAAATLCERLVAHKDDFTTTLPQVLSSILDDQT